MAKSKLVIQVNAYLAPFGNNVFSGDWLGLVLDDGNENTDTITVHETPSLNRTVKGLYINKKQNATDSAKNLASKFSADWKNTGGTNNIKVTYLSGNQIEFELQNENWTFDSVKGTGFTNGKITQVSLVNSIVATPKSFSIEIGTTGNCTNKTIEYTATIAGGISPYTIRGTADGNVQSTTTSKIINLKRGIATNVSVVDSVGNAIGSVAIEPPINLEPSHFNIAVSQDGASPSARVSANVVLPNSIFPLTYSLDDTNYGSSGNFPNLDYEQNYILYVKDKFGCTITKNFVTPEAVGGLENLDEQYERYFKISNAGTLIMTKKRQEGEKRNYSNTLSCAEIVNMPYRYCQEFDPTDIISQQFKSSYDWHRVTLFTGGQGIELSIVEQSKNLRIVEKVDCKLFRDDNGGLGIYFRNGNTYIEGTTTANGSSSYDAIDLPSWAAPGNKVYVDGIGTISIKRILTDTDRGLYLQMGASYGSLTDEDGKVQANYNRQPYNTYEFGFFMSIVQNTGKIVIEAGFNDMIEATYESELIKSVSDDDRKYLIQWSDIENKAGIVHQTGITHLARMYGSLRFLTNSESTTYRGDNETFNLEQNVYRTAELKLAVIGHGMENKIHLAAGMEDFFINGINYRKQKMESEPIEGTNYYIITATLETGGNELEVNRQELVLKEPLTSVTAKASIPDTVPSLLAIGNGGLMLNGSGGGIIVNT